MSNVQKTNKHASLFELGNILMKKDVGKNLLEEKIKISSCWNTEKKIFQITGTSYFMIFNAIF